jgi:hypothetical protein
MKLPPELKKVMHAHNITDEKCEQKVNQRAMHVINMYIKLIHFRLQDNLSDSAGVNEMQNERINFLLKMLQASN